MTGWFWVGRRRATPLLPAVCRHQLRQQFLEATARQWARTSDTWEWPLLENESEVHPHSGAGEYHASIAAASRDREAGDAGRDPVGPQPGPIATPAEAWLPSSRSRRGATLREDTLVWPEQRATVSLLRADDELG